jgi:hypothetical protein
MGTEAACLYNVAKLAQPHINGIQHHLTRTFKFGYRDFSYRGCVSLE